MALVKCSECGKDVSEKASTCPSCGNPLAIQAPEQVTAPIVLTKKRWKKMTVVGLFVLFIGFFMMFKSVGWGFFLMFVALVIAIVTRVGAWWTNG